MKVRISLLALLVCFSSAFARQKLVTGQKIIKPPINRIVTQQTARVLGTGMSEFHLRFEPGIVRYDTSHINYVPGDERRHGGIMRFGVEVGILKWMTIGIFYGAENWISSGNLTWQKLPGVVVKYFLCGESKWGPAITLGVDTQGWGAYRDNPFEGSKRYLIKAPGFFAAFSKNVYCRCFGIIGMHTGISYNLLENDDDPEPNLWFGLDKHLWRWFSFAVEYDPALNDNNAEAYADMGYLNIAIRYKYKSEWWLEFLLIDALSDSKITQAESRAFRFVFPIDFTRYIE